MIYDYLKISGNEKLDPFIIQKIISDGHVPVMDTGDSLDQLEIMVKSVITSNDTLHISDIKMIGNEPSEILSNLSMIFESKCTINIDNQFVIDENARKIIEFFELMESVPRLDKHTEKSIDNKVIEMYKKKVSIDQIAKQLGIDRARVWEITKAIK